MSRASLIYDSADRGSPMVEEFRELIRSRELLQQLITRNIKTRYKRSALGMVWTMVHPLMMMVVLTLAFSSIFRFSIPNFAVYVLSGLLLWNFFSQTTNSAMSELLWGGNLMHRIYVPRGMFAATAMGTGLVNLVLSLPALFLIMVLSGVPFRTSMLFLPISLLLVCLFTMGIALILSTMVIYFADVYEMFQILLMSWFYLQPIMYPIDIIPESRQWLFQLNPMYYFLSVFRSPIYGGQIAPLRDIATAAIIALVAFTFGWWLFTRQADELAYRV